MACGRALCFAAERGASTAVFPGVPGTCCTALAACRPSHAHVSLARSRPSEATLLTVPPSHAHAAASRLAPASTRQTRGHGVCRRRWKRWRCHHPRTLVCAGVRGGGG